MTVINVLLVNYDDDSMNTYAMILVKYGITAHPATDMLDALHMLLTGKYSGVSINADDFEYLPFLRIMRALTPAPIGISASRHNKQEHDSAIDLGADLYRVRFDDAEHRVRNFATVVKIYLEITKKGLGGILLSCWSRYGRLIKSA